jgi:putative ABC transport system permease protein
MLSGGGMRMSVAIENADRAPAASANVAMNVVSPGYLPTLGLSVVSGRNIAASDGPDSPDVALVNEALARRFFGAADPLGRRIFLDASRAANPFVIVGVVRDTPYQTLREAVPAVMYAPLSQMSVFAGRLSLHVRSPLPPGEVAGIVRRELRALDSEMPLFDVRTFTEQMGSAVAQERLVSALASGFGALALFLAALGLYGVLAYWVARSQKEIGIRLALGAEPGHVRAAVLRDTLVIAAIGLAAGIPLALWLGRYARVLLFEVAPTDPATLLVSSITLLVTVVLAGIVPARQATRVDPLVALRNE